jgi:hypothetical protein
VVTHEHGGGAPRPQVVRQEARTGGGDRNREREHGVVRVDRDRVDREEDRSDSRQRRREAVHVVEEVEGVRHPDEPDERDGAGEKVVRDQARDRESAADHEAGGGELRPQLDQRPEREEIVQQAGDEENRAAAEDGDQLTAGGRRPDGHGDPGAGQDPEEDPDAAEHRRGSLVPPIRAGSCGEPGRKRTAEQEPDGPGRGGKCSDRRELLHRPEA